MLEEHWKAVNKDGTMKSGTADHVWGETGDHQPLQNEVKILVREEPWRIRWPKESGIYEATMAFSVGLKETATERPMLDSMGSAAEQARRTLCLKFQV